MDFQLPVGRGKFLNASKREVIIDSTNSVGTSNFVGFGFRIGLLPAVVSSMVVEVEGSGDDCINRSTILISSAVVSEVKGE